MGILNSIREFVRLNKLQEQKEDNGPVLIQPTSKKTIEERWRPPIMDEDMGWIPIRTKNKTLTLDEVKLEISRMQPEELIEFKKRIDQSMQDKLNELKMQLLKEQGGSFCNMVIPMPSKKRLQLQIEIIEDEQKQK